MVPAAALSFSMGAVNSPRIAGSWVVSLSFQHLHDLFNLGLPQVRQENHEWWTLILETQYLFINSPSTSSGYLPHGAQLSHKTIQLSHFYGTGPQEAQKPPDMSAHCRSALFRELENQFSCLGWHESQQRPSAMAMTFVSRKTSDSDPIKWPSCTPKGSTLQSNTNAEPMISCCPNICLILGCSLSEWPTWLKTVRPSAPKLQWQKVIHRSHTKTS